MNYLQKMSLYELNGLLDISFDSLKLVHDLPGHPMHLLLTCQDPLDSFPLGAYLYLLRLHYSNGHEDQLLCDLHGGFLPNDMILSLSTERKAVELLQTRLKDLQHDDYLRTTASSTSSLWSTQDAQSRRDAKVVERKKDCLRACSAVVKVMEELLKASESWAQQVCDEPVEEGGEDDAAWRKMTISSYSSLLVWWSIHSRQRAVLKVMEQSREYIDYYYQRSLGPFLSSPSFCREYHMNRSLSNMTWLLNDTTRHHYEHLDLSSILVVTEFVLDWNVSSYDACLGYAQRLYDHLSAEEDLLRCSKRVRHLYK